MLLASAMPPCVACERKKQIIKMINVRQREKAYILRRKWHMLNVENANCHTLVVRNARDCLFVALIACHFELLKHVLCTLFCSRRRERFWYVRTYCTVHVYWSTIIYVASAILTCDTQGSQLTRSSLVDSYHYWYVQFIVFISRDK